MKNSKIKQMWCLVLLCSVGCLLWGNSAWASRDTYTHFGYAVKDNRGMDPLGGSHDAKVEIRDENNLLLWSENFCGDRRIAFYAGHYRVVLGDNVSNPLPVSLASADKLFIQLSLYVNRLPVNPNFCATPDTPAVQKEEISGTVWARESERAAGLLQTITVDDNVTGNPLYTLMLPPADGTPNQVLATDGSGNLHWADSGGPGNDKHSGQPTIEGDCGLSSYFVTGTDRAGIVTINNPHGSSPNGCSLTFHQPWKFTAACVVSPYVGISEFQLMHLVVRSINQNFFTAQRLDDSGNMVKFQDGDTFGYFCFAPE